MTILKLTGIAVVVFDLDDTLYPERQFVSSGFKAVGGWLRQRMTCPCDPADRMQELFDSGYRGRVFNQLLAEWGCSQAEQWLPQMIDCYRVHKPEIRLHPDAAEAIDRWQSTFQLALISDGPLAMQQNKVEALGLSSRLRPIVLTGQWGEMFSKPHLRAFEHVQGVAACQGSECVYIADNQLKDFVAPNLLGWRCVCVRRLDGIYADAQSPDGGEPGFQVSSLDEIVL